MRVLHAAAELYPFVKTGGLGDVLAALPAALRSHGVDARVLLPAYPGFLAAIEEAEIVAELGPGPGAFRARLRRGRVRGSGLPAYALEAPGAFERPGNPYAGPDGRDWPDNHRRFALLGWAAARLAQDADPEWAAEVVHAHDWHAALAPAYTAAWGRPARTVFTIHNLAFQGLFPAEVFLELMLPPSFFASGGVEYWGGVSFMKAALVFADRITTVSPTYAREIRTPELGMGLDGVLRGRGDAVLGILNGVDYAVWDPAHDPLLAAPYDPEHPSAKAASKAALQRELGLSPDPQALLLGAVTRLTGQKGFDLVLAAMPDLLREDAQLALLGSGEPELEQGFRRLAENAPAAAAARIGYDEALAHRIVGGADAMLVPSRFEPCGLTQLYALRYGTLPVVRRTGGLADTVVDADLGSLASGQATGFVFERADPADLATACRRALRLFREPERWATVGRRAMTRDFGWTRAAEQYAALYRVLLA